VIHSPDRVLRQSLTVLAIALAWFALFNLNDALFSELQHSIRAHWIFLPAVMRPLAILLFGSVGAWGLVLGAYLTVHGTTEGNALHEVTLALLSGLLPWLAVACARVPLQIPKSLSGLRPLDILVLCTLCAGVNAVGLNGYLWISGHLDNNPIQILTIFVGDLLGAAILLFLISSALAFWLPRRLRI